MKKRALATILIYSVTSLVGAVSLPTIKIKYYGEIGCSHCDLFEKSILPEIEQKTGATIELQAFDILDPRIYKECKTALNEMGLEFTIFPVLFVGNNAYLGNSALEAGLVNEINYVKKKVIFALQ